MLDGEYGCTNAVVWSINRYGNEVSLGHEIAVPGSCQKRRVHKTLWYKAADIKCNNIVDSRIRYDRLTWLNTGWTAKMMLWSRCNCNLWHWMRKWKQDRTLGRPGEQRHWERRRRLVKTQKNRTKRKGKNTKDTQNGNQYIITKTKRRAKGYFSLRTWSFSLRRWSFNSTVRVNNPLASRGGCIVRIFQSIFKVSGG